MGHHILEGTDSSGRTLESFISNVNPFPIGWQSEAHFLPGAPISKINTTGATSAAGTAYPFGAPEFTPSF
jgi:hypothetical protein